MKFQLIIDKAKDEEVLATVHAPSQLTDEIATLILSYSGSDRIQAFADDDWFLLSLEETECITVLNGKTYAIDSKGMQFRLKQRLCEIEKILPAYFIRINKSAFANEHRLERFAAVFSGGVDAVFRSGYRDYVSRRCFAEIKRRYK